MNHEKETQSEFPTHWLDIARIGKSGDQLDLVADVRVLKIFASQTPVETFDYIETKLLISRWNGNGALVEGWLSAEFSQLCVAKLEPFNNSLKTNFKRTFVPETDGRRFEPEILDGEILLDPEEDDLPDIVPGGKVNLWDVILEELNLEIDPYAHSPDAGESQTSASQVSEDVTTHRPFVGLEGLLTEKKPGNG